MKQKSKNRGFTLIELLVVVAIIGLLMSMVTIALSSARGKARDARRKEDIAEIRKALELYLHDNGIYPRNGTVGNPNNETDIQNLRSFLVPTYFSQIANDPKGYPNNYMYVWKDSGREYGLLVPFGNDGGIDCQFRTVGGSQNWFNKAPDCNY